jgi:hypothetical protein
MGVSIRPFTIKAVIMHWERMLTGRRTACATLALALSASAGAQDLAPRIDHVPIKQVKKGEPFLVRALIVSQSGKAIFEPTLYLRLGGFSGFTRIAMKAAPLMKDVYEARVPAEHMGGDFDYYVEAYDEDGNGPGRVGSPEAPLSVSVVAPAPPPPADRPTQVQLEPKPAPVQTIVVMQAPPPEPPHRSHVAPALLTTFGCFFSTATVAAAVGFNIESKNFTSATNNNGSFAASDYNTGKVLGYATEGGIVLSALLVAGALATGFWPHGDEAPAVTTATATPITVVTQPAPTLASQGTVAPPASTKPVPATTPPPAAKPASAAPPPQPKAKDKDEFGD